MFGFGGEDPRARKKVTGLEKVGSRFLSLRQLLSIGLYT
jgi:hypothetical protein